MGFDFIAQPHAEFRIGDFLKKSFTTPHWTEFRAAVAFVKRSGTKHIRDDLAAFSKRATVKISAGIDADGTSEEGLSDLISAVGDRGKVFVFKNANSSTFHPKIYLFKNEIAAELIVGSGNLTEGGIFTNYEASLLMQLDFSLPEHLAFLAKVEETLDSWSTPTPGLCHELNPGLLEQLVRRGEIPNEAKAWGDEKKEAIRITASADELITEVLLFGHHSVPPAPRVPRKITVRIATPRSVEEPKDEDEDEDEDLGLEVPILSPVPEQMGAYKIFLMTLQRTDVGVGQTTKGTSRRSPEIFIPLICRDYDPEFWGWPSLFTPDTEWKGPLDKLGRGKMDRPAVMVRIGGNTIPVNFWYNPEKKDLRLRSESLRSAGNISDILYVERSDGKDGFAYYVEIVPQGSTKHAEYALKCTNPVRNSKKLWAYL